MILYKEEVVMEKVIDLYGIGGIGKSRTLYLLAKQLIKTELCF